MRSKRSRLRCWVGTRRASPWLLAWALPLPLPWLLPPAVVRPAFFAAIRAPAKILDELNTRGYRFLQIRDILVFVDGRDFLMSELPVLIIGDGGKTGARVNSLLTARGIATWPASRSTAVSFDWARPETWPAALDGVSKAYVTYQPDLAVEGATEAIAALSRLARDKRLERVVLLSGRGEPGAQRAERTLQTSGVPGP